MMNELEIGEAYWGKLGGAEGCLKTRQCISLSQKPELGPVLADGSCRLGDKLALRQCLPCD